jgi:hypothetical protein
MQFLKTLFWVLLAVVVALFPSGTGSTLTVNLLGRHPGGHQSCPHCCLSVSCSDSFHLADHAGPHVVEPPRRIDAMERNRVATLALKHRSNPWETAA